MDFNAITQVVSTLGFPIAMCGAMFWHIIKSEERHREEVSKLSEALNNNTIALTRLVARLDGDTT